MSGADVSGEDAQPAWTRFSVASVTKPLTATAIMRLVQTRGLSLDTPVNHLLGSVTVQAARGSVDSITLRRVLSHTAGFPSSVRFFYPDAKEPSYPPDTVVARYGTAVHVPGSEYEYSNFGYAVLGLVLEHQHGRPFAEIIRRDVFEPLGMLQSTIGLPTGQAAGVAIRYERDSTLPFYTTAHPGASEMFTTAADLLTFARYSLLGKGSAGRTILDDSLRVLMQQAQTPPGASAQYGLGWEISDEHGLRRVAHGGYMPGVAAMLNLFPTEGIALVILLNARVWPRVLAEDIVALLVPSYARALQGDKDQEVQREAQAERSRSLGALRGQWTGHVHDYLRTHPLSLCIRDSTSIATLDGTTRTARVSAEDWGVSGSFDGPYDLPEARVHPHRVAFEMRGDDGRLSGWLGPTTGWFPRFYFTLPGYVTVEKVSDRCQAL